MCHHRCARFCFSRCETSVQRRRANGGHRGCSYRGKNWPGKVPWGPWRLESTIDGHVALLRVEALALWFHSVQGISTFDAQARDQERSVIRHDRPWPGPGLVQHSLVLCKFGMLAPATQRVAGSGSVNFTTTWDMWGFHVFSFAMTKLPRAISQGGHSNPSRAHYSRGMEISQATASCTWQVCYHSDDVARWRTCPGHWQSEGPKFVW